jgi:TIGR03009 family protein
MWIFKKTFKRITVCVCLLLQFATQVMAQSDTAEVRSGDIPGQIDPQLEKILNDWEDKTKGITKLSGTHRRFVYDRVFEVEKRADGKFYYESPDKGRIDIEVVEIGKNEQSQKIGKSGKPYEVKSDLPEKWICDGKSIAQADVREKTHFVFPLPPDQQGQNIMDGPLPFLFGLPAQVAQARYHIATLPQTNQQFVWLRILPKRSQDAANWSSAEVILVRETYLPYAVKLFDPSGNRETVYRFEDLKPNAISIPIFGRDPFDIERVLRGYKELKSGQQNAEGVAQQPGPRPAGPVSDHPPVTIPKENITVKPATGVTMPDASNYPWETLKKFFESKGFKVEFRKAKPAPTPEMVYAIAAQQPKAGEPVEPGQTVIFWLYDEIKTAEKP